VTIGGRSVPLPAIGRVALVLVAERRETDPLESDRGIACICPDAGDLGRLAIVPRGVDRRAALREGEVVVLRKWRGWRPVGIAGGLLPHPEPEELQPVEEARPSLNDAEGEEREGSGSHERH
jgi:hypothetical protein